MKRCSLPKIGKLDPVRLLRALASEDGSILVQAALSMTVLCGMLALAIDVGRFLHIKREVQTLADASALAAGLEIAACSSSSNCADMQAAAKSALVENGIAGSNITVATQCANSNVASGVILYVNNPPCWLGANDPNNGKSSYAETVISYKASSIFGRVLGQFSFKVLARAEAGGTKPKYCMYILGNSANALLVNGNSTLTANCGIIDNSNASPAAIFNGNDRITSTRLDIVGSVINNGNNTISPAATTGAKSVSDPLSSLSAPTVGACGSSTSSPYTGSSNQVIVNGQNSAVFNPGVYCNGITLNGGASATFNPGTYIIKNGMIVGGNGSITGSGVTLYVQSGQFIINGTGHVALTAPTSGTYEGILYWQASSDSNQMIMNGDTTSIWQGVIYTPGANVTLNGGSNVAAYTDFVVNTLTQNGNVNFTIGSDYSSLSHGPPIKKHLIISAVE